VVNEDALDALLSVMNNVFVPTLMESSSFAVSTRNDILVQLERFMATLTEVAHLSHGRTVLYVIPTLTHDNVTAQELAQDKDFVHRLEALVIHWTRQ
ncbi:dynein heavy chain, partial [Kipferlia bialata]